ncbi:exopolyphosphatase [Heliorestis acidaminivorans]|uniref:Exopolyphosphatase n=1 Tax=Heliorestis acidaminivorans TaxID=553427 RepID=A0A6I0F0F0_9FIRM|nr:exopolyphosphatase [Heliorestis acidaminivorans]KAB2953336.1 exopolyphosphatase [Heliorestis acidaminivorans]
MERVGIIDLGSNSVRLMVVQLSEDGSYKLIDEAKEGVRLSQGMGPEKILRPFAIKRTIDVLRLFQNLCQAHGVNKILAVATAAVRQALNQADFLLEVKNSTGLDFTVLSGYEEAQTVYYGVINTVEVEDGLIVDIGGGSTELVLVENRRISHAISLPFGAVTLTELFLNADKPTEEELKKMEIYLRQSFNQISWLQTEPTYPVIGLGGTFRNLSKIDRKRKQYSFDVTHNYRMTNNDVQEIYRLLKCSNLEKRKKIVGLSKDRADIIVAGVSIVNELAHYMTIQEVIICGSGLRDGLLYKHLLRHQVEPIVENVRAHSVDNLMKYYDLESKHSRHVAKLTLSMFDQLLPIHELDEQARKVLEVASLLHDVGIVINFYDHYKHSFYIIANSRINGLSHREILLTAFTAASHAKQIREQWIDYSDILSKKDWDMVRKLSILLRIAEALERSEAAIIKDVRCHQYVDAIHISAITTDPADLEICHAHKVADDFKRVFGHKLIITTQPLVALGP